MTFSKSTLCLLLLTSLGLAACSESNQATSPAPVSEPAPTIEPTTPPASAPAQLEDVVNAAGTLLHTTKQVTEQLATNVNGELMTETQEKLNEASSKALETTAVVAEKVAEKAKELKASVDTKAQLAEVQKLAQQSGCLACHAIDKKLIGPSYQEVAAKYAGQANAQQQLIHSISKGSSGKWGSMPMPAHSPKLDDATIAKLASWVLVQ